MCLNNHKFNSFIYVYKLNKTTICDHTKTVWGGGGICASNYYYFSHPYSALKLFLPNLVAMRFILFILNVFQV